MKLVLSLGCSAEHARGFCSAVDKLPIWGWTKLEKNLREKTKSIDCCVGGRGSGTSGTPGTCSSHIYIDLEKIYFCSAC